METELETNLKEILREKEEKILPENIKSGVNILGIEGIYTGEKEMLNIITGEEFETGRIINGKKEYGKLINGGKFSGEILGDKTYKTVVDLGLNVNQLESIKIEELTVTSDLITTNFDGLSGINYYYISKTNNTIVFTTDIDRSSLTINILLSYIKI